MNEKLQEFFKEHNKVAIAFSGGVDSTFLLYAAKQCNADVRAYFVKTEFIPKYVFDEAINVAYEVECDMRVVRAEALADPSVTDNDSDRCYYCKRNMLQSVIRKAYADGYETILDGTNASDDVKERAGFKAIKELRVLSPLRDAGITKEMIRQYLKEAGISVWNKPSYSCLATRIPTGVKIDDKNLTKIDAGEAYLRMKGFSDFRVRLDGEYARIELTEEDYHKAMDIKDDIIKTFRKYFYDVIFDENFRKSI